MERAKKKTHKKEIVWLAEASERKCCIKGIHTLCYRHTLSPIIICTVKLNLQNNREISVVALHHLELIVNYVVLVFKKILLYESLQHTTIKYISIDGIDGIHKI